MDIGSAVTIAAALIVLTAIIIMVVWLQRDTNTQYDLPLGEIFYPSSDSKTRVASTTALKAIYRQIKDAAKPSESKPLKRRIDHLRAVMDQLRTHIPLASAISPVDAGGVPSEWVIAPGSDPSRRLLYIHGGGFVAGSPTSHRIITSKLSEISNSAVLAIDYRLSPEHKREACIEDCRTAYDWLLANGPEGESAASAVYVAGDSAGGNLTLSLLAWARDTQRRAPNAAVALSPVTDMRMVNPSIKANLNTDIMLKPIAEKLAKIPRWLMLSAGAFIMPYNTKDPDISPLLGKLHDLPPTLIQASDGEILLDDGRRYTNKARAAGSNVTLQLWSGMPHVWQLFHPELQAAQEAFDQIEQFIARYP
jgi:acetyl esterase/lipase|tara:strand:+ start:279 stop:1370 length:1092 start_codon:yes stop_codon:yes gene_type:complete